ncbi:MAG: efflux RND transporter periplasmic adaptor subunit [Bacteroidales bacterium]|nr:efflux RND transporter periplasmic adaptor subunit [Bacteroidales bacterium]
MNKVITNILALSAAIMVVSACGGNQTASGVKNPIKVKVEAVAATAQSGAISYVGTVEEAQATAVSFTGMGTVTRVAVSEGQAVSKGQLIAEIDDTQARNLLTTAQAMADQANDAYARYSQLHESGSMAESQWIEVQSKVAQANAQLEIAKKNLNDCRLTAPVSGIIGKKKVNAGETVVPSQTVATILDISSVWVKVAVPEEEIGKIATTTKTGIGIKAIGKDVPGGRIEKGIVADALTHTYSIRINVANPGRDILPGMVASVNINADASEDGITLPVESVQKAADGSLFVWVAESGAAAMKTVTTGGTIGNRIMIKSGLSGGDNVIVEGWQKVGLGTKVVY